MSKVETTIEELQTTGTPPTTIHLNIGMRGILHTYHLEQAKQSKKPRKRQKAPPGTQTPPLKKPSLLDSFSDRVFGGKG